MESPYEVLGVERDADDEAVVRAYRRRVKEAHPDAGGSVEEFRRVRDAYEAVVAGEVPTTPATLDEETAGEDASDGGGAAVDGTDAHAGGEGDRPRGRPAGSRAPGVGGGAASGRQTTPDDGPDQCRVEFLNYAAVEDRGWTLRDDDLFDRAAAADLDHADYGRFVADTDEMLLEAAEAQGYGWPFACRGGACANCAVFLADGAVETTVDNVLSEEVTDAGFRLSCICKPAAEHLRVVYNVKHLPGLDEFRLPATRFERAWSDD